MKKRLLVAGILLMVLGGAFAFRLIDIYGIFIFDLLIAALAIFCSLESAKLLNDMGKPASYIGAGLYPSLMFAGHMFSFLFKLKWYWYITIQLSLLIVAALIIFIFYASLNTSTLRKSREEKHITRVNYGFKVSLNTLFTFIYPTTFLLGLMLLNRIDYLGVETIGSFGGNLGWVVLILAFLIPIITDSAAMFSGMIFKGPKLCPKISPNKTISGAVCATIITSVITGAFFYIFNAFAVLNQGFINVGIKSYHFVILGFFGAIICQIGDVFESFLKRRAGVKDSGNIFPGHGGFLDRMDSHIFNAPYVFIFFMTLILINL